VPSTEHYARLSSIDVAEISGFDTVDVMKGWSRQVSRVRAQFLRAVLETGLRQPGSGEYVAAVPEPSEFSSEEARAALMWSRRRARETFELAWDIHARLPILGAAMLAGELDENRAAALAQWTRDLADPIAERICEQLIQRAEEITVGALIHEIKRLAISFDPEWAERQYRAAIARRRVIGQRNGNGTASVSGVELPVERAKAGCDRIDILARSCKTAGDSRPIDHVRADLFLGMLDGTFTGLSEAEIVQYVPAHPLVPAEDSENAHTPGPQPEAESQQPPEESQPEPQQPAQPPQEPPASGHGRDGENGQEPGSSQVRRPPGPRSPSGGCATQAESLPCVRELRIELTTLLGQDQHPAEIPPWGYVSADLGRKITLGMVGAQWRFVVCDDDGRPICSGITPSRPARASPSQGEFPDRRQPRRGVVEIQVRASDLSWLDAASAETGLFPEWIPVIENIAGRLDLGNVDTDAAAADARRRVPGAALRRLVQVRARCCPHPACLAPAITCDQDHVVEYAEGGVTTLENLHPPCRHDHRLRHEGGWNVCTQIDGTTVWTSALGRAYISRPPPVIRESPNRWSMLKVVEPLEAEQPMILPELMRNRAELLDDDLPPPF
jgi:hypothetical protein